MYAINIPNYIVLYREQRVELWCNVIFAQNGGGRQFMAKIDIGYSYWTRCTSMGILLIFALISFSVPYSWMKNLTGKYREWMENYNKNNNQEPIEKSSNSLFCRSQWHMKIIGHFNYYYIHLGCPFSSECSFLNGRLLKLESCTGKNTRSCLFLFQWKIEPAGSIYFLFPRFEKKEEATHHSLENKIIL